MKKVLHILPLLLCILLMQACSPSIPSDYIQPGDMEDILYDYQVAQAMGYQSNDQGQTPSDVDRNVYKLAALKKHGVTQQEFDTSLEYYMRHTEELHKIYENLAKRLTKEAESLGASIGEDYQLGAAQQGDTANVWNRRNAVVLTTDDYLNRESFHIKADSSYHKGDKLMLEYDAQFVVQDGSRDAVIMLAVTFDNDSTATQVTHLSSNGHHSLSFANNGGLAIKDIRGFFIYNRGENASTSTLRLLCLYNIRLTRTHVAESANPAEGNKADSLRQTSSTTTPVNTPVSAPVSAPNGQSPAQPASAGQPVSSPQALDMKKLQPK